MIRMSCLLIGSRVKRVGRGPRTGEVQAEKLNSKKYVVASKGFQKLTLVFFLFVCFFSIIIFIIIFIVLHYCINAIVNVCVYAIIINVSMFLAQSLGMCSLYIDSLRAVWDA